MTRLVWFPVALAIGVAVGYVLRRLTEPEQEFCGCYPAETNEEVVYTS